MSSLVVIHRLVQGDSYKILIDRCSMFMTFVVVHPSNGPPKPKIVKINYLLLFIV